MPGKQWVPNAADPSMSPAKAGLIGAAIGVGAAVTIGALILALDQAYDQQRYAYWTYDRSFDAVFVGVPETYWYVGDVYLELASIPRAELAYTFDHCFYPGDVGYFCEAIHVSEFTSVELNTWSRFDSYEGSAAPGELLTLDYQTPAELAALEANYEIHSELIDEQSYNSTWDETTLAKVDLEHPHEVTPEPAEPPEPAIEHDIAAPPGHREQQEAEAPHPAPEAAPEAPPAEAPAEDPN